MPYRSLIVIALAYTCFGVATMSYALLGQKPTDVKTQLMDADRAFAKVTFDKGIEGWMSVMADDAVRVAPLGGKGYIGKAAVRELETKLFEDPNAKLIWEPTDGGAFADGKHGFTTGKAKYVVKNADGKEEVKSTSAYMTIWRKGDDGIWKVILDTGATDAKKSE